MNCIILRVLTGDMLGRWRKEVVGTLLGTVTCV